MRLEDEVQILSVFDLLFLTCFVSLYCARIALVLYRDDYYYSTVISGSFMTLLDLGHLLSITPWC